MRVYLLMAISIIIIGLGGPAYGEGPSAGQVIELINILKEKGVLTEDEAKRPVENSIRLEEKKKVEEMKVIETLLSKGAPTLTPAKGLTFQPGLRVQLRYVYDDDTNNNDMMIRRTRLKLKGDAYDMVKYYLEWKIDNVGQEGKTATEGRQSLPRPPF